MVDQFFVHENRFNLIWFSIVNSWHYLFSSQAGGRRKPAFASNSDVSTRNLYCTNFDRRNPSLSRLHYKLPKSRKNTQTPSLHRRRRSRQSCAPTTNCPSCKRRRGTSRSRQKQSTRTLTPLRPPAVRARQQRGLAFALGGGMQSSGAKWADSEKSHIITTKGRKCGLATTRSTRGMRKPGSPACCNVAFHCRHFPLSNIAGYDLAQDKFIYFWDVQRRKRTIEAKKKKKRQLAKDAVLASNARRSLKFEYLLNWLALEAKICIRVNLPLYADLNMPLYADLYMQKYARNMQQYHDNMPICQNEVPNMQEYAQRCKKRKMQYMCIISSNICKTKYARTCKNTICINVYKIYTNTQNQICINMHFQICIFKICIFKICIRLCLYA